MSGHECDRALRDLDEYVHQEMERTEYLAITRHLAECVDCADEYRVSLVLTEVVRRSCRDTAPDVLREQVLLQLRLQTSR